MTGRLRVGLLFGGRSVEHEVSVTSARSVARALGRTSLECVPIGVTGDGRWLSPERSKAILDSTAARAEPHDIDDDGVRVAVDPGGERLVCLVPEREPRTLRVDVVFPLVHGWGGEDGRVQGALELAGIPYVGAGVLASAAGMDKAVARQLFERAGLPGVRWTTVHEQEHDRDPADVIGRIVSDIGFPLFVKPANGGSSVGITRVGVEDALPAALEEAFACDAKVVVEQGIDAREIECAVLGNDEPKTSVLGEIIPSREFYDYQAKYVDDASELKIPADLDPETARRIRNHAADAFRCLGLQGMARVDFLVEHGTGRVHLNEVNTLPGFTPISMFPRLWEATGLPFPRLLARLVELARERWQSERRRRTFFHND